MKLFAGPKKAQIPDINPEAIIRALGYDIGELRSKNKCFALADKRRVVACVLRHLGMAEWHIGDVLNRKRVSVNAMLRTSYLVEKEIAEAIELIEKLGYGKEKKEEL